LEFNPEIPENLFGKWNKSPISQQYSEDEHIRVEHEPERQTKDQLSTVSKTKLNATQPNALLGNDTASWVRNHSMEAPGWSTQEGMTTQDDMATSEIQEMQEIELENNCASRATNFLIPSNPIEREQMINRRVGVDN
jgi:hypothetical protein